MKKTGFIITVFFVAIMLTAPIYASDINDKITSSITDELSGFENSLPDNIKDFFPDGTLRGDFSHLIEGEINEKSFLSLTAEYLTFGINQVLKSFSSVLVLIILISVFNALNASLSDTGVGLVFSLCSSLCISITVFNICSGLVTNAGEYIKLLCSIMGAFVPIILAMLTMGGNISAAIVSNGSMLLFINIVESFLLAFMLPLTSICLAFGCARSLNGELDLSGITKTLKTTFTSVTVFVMSILMFVLSYKNTIAQGVDSLSIKTARFAISSFVPLVGSSVNESLRTVTTSLSLIKSSCGIIAIISIAVLMLPIIINLFLNKVSFSILATMSKAIGGQREAAILEEADSVCGFVLTLVCCSCVLFIFALTIFIKTDIGGAF